MRLRHLLCVLLIPVSLAGTRLCARYGRELLRNFIYNTCGAVDEWRASSFVADAIDHRVVRGGVHRYFLFAG